jgi:hypothetical protein
MNGRGIARGGLMGLVAVSTALLMGACGNDSPTGSAAGGGPTTSASTSEESGGAATPPATTPGPTPVAEEALTWPCLLTNDEVASVLGPHQAVEMSSDDATCIWYAEGSTASRGPSFGLHVSSEGTGQQRMSEPFPAEEVVTDSLGVTAYYNPNDGTLEFLCQPDRSCTLQFGSGYDGGTSPVLTDPDALRNQMLVLGQALNERINEPQGD